MKNKFESVKAELSLKDMYRTLAERFHPDKKDLHKALFYELQEAYNEALAGNESKINELYKSFIASDKKKSYGFESDEDYKGKNIKTIAY